MSKITYLLGAGASKEALPLAKDLADGLLQFSEKILRPAVRRTHGKPRLPLPRDYELAPKGPYAKELVQSFEWLGTEAKRHASVDTYAKKLFIRDDADAKESLHRLKVTLSSYLLLEQSLNPTDKRYDSFLASILSPGSDGRPQWPEGVNVITWNYDTQLEKSYKEFCRDANFVYEGITNSKNITRLNGACGVPDRIEMRDLCHSEFDKSFFEKVWNLFDAQMKRSQPYLPSISFAWEKTDFEEAIIRSVRGTTTLIVIGYSFQYFNRDVDEFLLLNMVGLGGLEKIFIQVAESEQSSVQERFLTLFENEDVKKEIKGKITPVSTGPFYIPDNMPR